MKNQKDVKVYIASPYTKGDMAQNVNFQMKIADELINKGFIPFVPLYTHFQHMFYPQSYETWLHIDFKWIESCRVLLRLGGESPGADREVEYAKEKNIPVFYSLEKLYEFFK